MSTNPNNAVGTNGAFGGRTSVNAFNDGIAGYSAGILSGWACEPDSGLTVVIGGDGNTRDVAIAEDNAGNKTTINNISGSPISVTVGAAPNSNSRIDSIVAYVDNPPTGSATATDNYGACGLIVVSGTVASTPTAPNESTIRTAITADGASGTTAYYVILANVTIPSGTTDLTSDNIEAGANAGIGSNNIDFATFGNQSSYIELGDIVIQWGTAQNTNQSVSLPVQMENSSYSVSVTPVFQENKEYLWWAHIYAQQTQSFTYRAGYKEINGTDGGRSNDVTVRWIVIGRKAS